MAANYAAENDVIEGLVLYGSYPQGDKLKDSDINVISIYGSKDGVADLEKVKNAILPKNSKLIEIEGGNHAGFGSYGPQKGDNEATITGEEQLEEESINEYIKIIEEALQ